MTSGLNFNNKIVLYSFYIQSANVNIEINPLAPIYIEMWGEW